MGLGKEAKIGLIVIGGLLLIFSVVLTLRLMTTKDKPLARLGRGDDAPHPAAGPASNGSDRPEALAGATVVTANGLVKSPTSSGWNTAARGSRRDADALFATPPSYMPHPASARSAKTLAADDSTGSSGRVTAAILSSSAADSYLRLASDTSAAAPAAPSAAAAAPAAIPSTSATFMPAPTGAAASSASSSSSASSAGGGFMPPPPPPLTSSAAAAPAPSPSASVTLPSSPTAAPATMPNPYAAGNYSPNTYSAAPAYAPAGSAYPPTGSASSGSGYGSPGAGSGYSAAGAAANPMAGDAAASSGRYGDAQPRYGDAQPRYGDSGTGYGDSGARYGDAAAYRGNRSRFSGEPPRSPDGTYKVMPGDNYWTICEKVYGNGSYFKALAEHNRGKTPRDERLQPGVTIQTPPLAELAKNYPDFCPKPSHQRAAGSQFATVSTTLPHGGQRIYKVHEGDTLFEIARHELGSPARWAEIYQLNRGRLGDDYDYLTPGLELVLPGGDAAAAKVTQRAPGAYQR